MTHLRHMSTGDRVYQVTFFKLEDFKLNIIYVYRNIYRGSFTALLNYASEITLNVRPDEFMIEVVYLLNDYRTSQCVALLSCIAC